MFPGIPKMIGNILNKFKDNDKLTIERTHMKISHAARQVIYEMCNITPFKELELIKEAMSYMETHKKKDHVVVDMKTIDKLLGNKKEVSLSEKMKKDLKMKLDAQDKYAWAGKLYIELDTFFS